MLIVNTTYMILDANTNSTTDTLTTNTNTYNSITNPLIMVLLLLVYY